MFEWLKTRCLYPRADNRIIAFKISLADTPLENRAYIHCLAMFRHQHFPKQIGQDIHQIIDNPHLFSNEICLNRLFLLKVFMNQITQAHTKISHLIENSYAQDLLEPYQLHAKALEQSMEIWVMTLSAGIEAQNLKAVQHCWQYLHEAHEYRPQAIEKIKTFENKLNYLIRDAPSVCNRLENQTWEKWCQYTPTFIL